MRRARDSGVRWYFGWHCADDTFYPIQRGRFLFSTSCCNPRVFSGHVEEFGPCFLNTRLVTGSPRAPLEEFLLLCEGGIKGSLAQALSKLLAQLLRNALLECDGLFGVELFARYFVYSSNGSSALAEPVTVASRCCFACLK